MCLSTGGSPWVCPCVWPQIKESERVMQLQHVVRSLAPGAAGEGSLSTPKTGSLRLPARFRKWTLLAMVVRGCACCRAWGRCDDRPDGRSERADSDGLHARRVGGAGGPKPGRRLGPARGRLPHIAEAGGIRGRGGGGRAGGESRAVDRVRPAHAAPVTAACLCSAPPLPPACAASAACAVPANIPATRHCRSPTVRFSSSPDI